MNKKVGSFIFVAAILLIGSFFYRNRVKSEVNTYPISDSITFSVQVNKGNIDVSTSSQDTVTILTNYQGEKPAVSFEQNMLTFLSKETSNIQEVFLTLPTKTNIVNGTIKIGSGNLQLNLRNALVENLVIEAGSTNVELTVPGSKSSRFTLSAGAGNIALKIPQKETLGGIKIKPGKGTLFTSEQLTGFKKVGDSYETENFDKAEVTSTINISLGSGNFTFETVE